MSDPIMPPLTAAQLANLEKLAVHLEKLPESYQNFSMDHWAVIHASRDDEYNPDPCELRPDGIGYRCGAVACAVGHGPAAGVCVTGHMDSWVSYEEAAFGVSRGIGYRCGVYGTDFEVVHLAWTWMFDFRWSQVDNSPAGAAQRIRQFLAGGVPDTFYPDVVFQDYRDAEEEEFSAP